MAANAGHGSTGSRDGVDVVNEGLVTIAAGAFRSPPAPFPDLDRVVKVAGGEGERMKEAVLGFGEILPHKSGRGVAIVAGGDRAMARFHIGIKMVPHDVAIRAGVG